jgi:copper transport protein
VRKQFLVAVGAALLFPTAAWAHANLVRTQPTDGAVLAHAPPTVRVVFDDAVHPGPGIAAIRNGDGSILAGKAHVERGSTLVIPLRRGIGNGAYSVRWSIVSDDGHLESGVLAFAVGPGQPVPKAALAAEGAPRAVDEAPGRWLFFAGVLGAVGIALFALVARRDDDSIALILSTAAVLAALGGAEGAHRFGLDTRAGVALGAGFVTAVVVATLASAALLDRRALRPAAVLALGLAAVPSVAGHALDRGLDRVNLVADILHVTGAAAWVGALLGLVFVPGAPRRRVIALAAGGVALLSVTGVVRASFELLHVSQLWDTSYGRTLLVKTGLLLAALGVGRLLRARLRVRAAVELAFVAAVLVAVSFLVLLRPGRNVAAAVRQVNLDAPSPAAQAPPPNAVVLAHEVGPLGVALAAEPARLTAIVLSPAGGGLDGLAVRIDGRPASSCGQGCYRVGGTHGRRVVLEIAGAGSPRRTSFVLPRSAPAGASLVRRVQRRFRRLESVRFAERLASDETNALTAEWRLERPNRVAYAIPGGAQGIVIGDRRWDRSTPSARWQESSQTPLTQPATQWNVASNAHVLESNGDTKTVSFVDPSVPAYFTMTVDARTLRPRVLRMTAAAHFMTDRYLAFNEPRAIRPPR